MKPEKTQENTTFVIEEKHRASSYEFGKAGNRFKLYFEDAEDLREQLDALEAQKIYIKEKE